MNPEKLNHIDIIIGTDKSRPLVRLLIEALLKYQERDSDLISIFRELIEKDEISSELFEKLNLKQPAYENTTKYLIRCALLVLDSEVSHQLISILIGFDLRGIIITAHYIAKIFSKIIFTIDNISELEEGYLALLLNQELSSIKSIIEEN